MIAIAHRLYEALNWLDREHDYVEDESGWTYQCSCGRTFPDPPQWRLDGRRHVNPSYQMFLNHRAVRLAAWLDRDTRLTDEALREVRQEMAL